MNHISTLTVTQSYIHNEVKKIASQQNEDILQIVSSLLAAIDERFQKNEFNIRDMQRKLMYKEEKID